MVTVVTPSRLYVGGNVDDKTNQIMHSECYNDVAKPTIT